MQNVLLGCNHFQIRVLIAVLLLHHITGYVTMAMKLK